MLTASTHSKWGIQNLSSIMYIFSRDARRVCFVIICELAPKGVEGTILPKDEGHPPQLKKNKNYNSDNATGQHKFHIGLP